MTLLQGRCQGVTLMVLLGGCTDAESKVQRGQATFPGSHSELSEERPEFGTRPRVIEAGSFLLLICFQPRAWGQGSQMGMAMAGRRRAVA